MPSKRPSDGWTDQLIDQWAIHGSTKWLIESHKMPLTLLKNVEKFLKRIDRYGDTLTLY